MSPTKNKKIIATSIAVIIFGLCMLSAKRIFAQGLYVPPVGDSCEVDPATGGCRESAVKNPPVVPVIYGLEDEEPVEPVVGSGGIVGDEQTPPVIQKPVTPPPKKTIAPRPVQTTQPKKQITAETDSEVLLDAVMATYNKQHQDEVATLKQYYTKPPLFKPATNAQYAQKDLDQLRPLGVDVVSAKGDYEDALYKGANQSEIANLENAYNAKLQDLKTQLQDILTIDKGNPDALWQMGTLSKWEGDNAQSYENYRDALMSQKSRNPFKYQQLLDSVNNPAIRIKLMQDLEPNENIIEIPTTKTSPFLAGLKSNLDTLVQPLTSAKKTVAENIEKISRAFSFSDQFDKAIKTLGITQ